MGKRANGEGSIYKLKKSDKNGNEKIVWVASIMTGRDKSGKPVLKKMQRKTQKEAQKALEDYKRKMSMGVLNEEKIILQDWFYTWLFEYRKQDLKPKSFDRYFNIYKKYISDSSIGKIKLCDLKTTHLQIYYNELEKNEVSANTIKQINTKLKTCLEEAKRQQYIQQNWCKLVKLPRIESNEEVKVLTEKEQFMFLQEIKGHELEMFFIVALGTGLRRGELQGLKWSDINFKTNELTVQRTLQKVPIHEDDKTVRYEIIEQSPKTKNSIRTIPIPEPIMKKLKEHKKKQNEIILKIGEEYNNKDYVLCDPLGNPFEEKRPNRNLQSILKKIDIEPMKFHALRHTYATRLFEQGEAPKTVQKLLGHADINTTMNIYTHVMKEKKTEAVEKLNYLFV